MYDLAGKVALVTGAGSGIGKASALKLAEAGATVIVMSRTAEEVEQTAREIESKGGRAQAKTADTSDDAAMHQLIADIIHDFTRLDIVVANAGINGMWAPIDDLTPDEWDQTMTVNLRGTYMTLHLAVPHLKKQGGSIAIVSSINGNRTFTSAGATAYSATKAAIQNFTVSMAQLWAEKGIRVNCVAPGPIWTPLIPSTMPLEKVNSFGKDVPMKRPGQPAELAAAFVLLASNDSSYMTGSTVQVTGGYPTI